MKRLLLAAALVAAGCIGAASAIGQDTGGSVGPQATGTLSFEVVFTPAKRRGGINPAVPRDKKRPKVMDMLGGNVDILVNGKKVGRAHGFEVLTFEGAKKYKGGAEGVSTTMLDFGSDNLIFMTCRFSDDERSNPCAITGGTGVYAGARGTGVEGYTEGREQGKKFFLPVRLTFIS